MSRQLPLTHIITITLVLALTILAFPQEFTPLNSLEIASLVSQGHQGTEISSPGEHASDTLAALTIYLEARGESFAGKMAVAAVIRNRMHYRYHSDGTVKGTVLRAKQFEPWITLKPRDIVFNIHNVKMRESLMAWHLVQDGRKVVEDAVLFFNPHIVRAPRWARVNRKVATIGGHDFFNRHRI